jgi:hypothetical protein
VLFDCALAKRLDTLRAQHLLHHSTAFGIEHRTFLEIRAELTLSAILGVGNIMPEHGLFAAIGAFHGKNSFTF